LQLVHASVCKIYSQTVAHFPQAYVLTVSQISTYEAGLAFRRQLHFMRGVIKIVKVDKMTHTFTELFLNKRLLHLCQKMPLKQQWSTEREITSTSEGNT